MFKKLVPVVALALLAGPVFAADAPASSPSADQSSTASSKHHSKKHSYLTGVTKAPPQAGLLFCVAPDGSSRDFAHRACGFRQTGSNSRSWMGRNRPQYIRRWFPFNLP